MTNNTAYEAVITCTNRKETLSLTVPASGHAAFAKACPYVKAKDGDAFFLRVYLKKDNKDIEPAMRVSKLTFCVPTGLSFTGAVVLNAVHGYPITAIKLNRFGKEHRADRYDTLNISCS